jgi:tetratricopeptide (TPR) repeat protein
VSQIVIASGAIRYDVNVGVARAAVRKQRAARRARLAVVLIAMSAAIGYYAMRPVAPVDLTLIIRATPQKPELWLRLAQSAAAAGRAPQAEGAYGVVRLLNPGDATVRYRRLDHVPELVASIAIDDAEWVGALATKAEEATAVSVAEQLYSRARMLDPSNAKWARGIDRMRALQSSSSVSQDSAVARQLKATITEGDLYRDHGQYQKAIDTYRNALRFDPQNATLADRIQRTTNAMETERRLRKDE